MAALASCEIRQEGQLLDTGLVKFSMILLKMLTVFGEEEMLPMVLRMPKKVLIATVGVRVTVLPEISRSEPVPGPV